MAPYRKNEARDWAWEHLRGVANVVTRLAAFRATGWDVVDMQNLPRQDGRDE
jgi:hypothetical protein